MKSGKTTFCRKSLIVYPKFIKTSENQLWEKEKSWTQDKDLQKISGEQNINNFEDCVSLLMSTQVC